MLPPTPKISLISRTTGSRVENSTRLVLALNKRISVESLQVVFNDSGYLPHIEEIPDMLDMKSYLSDVECPSLYDIPLYCGYVLHFKAPDDADRALAIFNLRHVPGIVPPTPMFLFKDSAVRSFKFGAVARRIHPIPNQWSDAAVFMLVRKCGPVRFAYIHPAHGAIIHFDSEEQAKATESAMKVQIGEQVFQPMVATTVLLSSLSDKALGTDLGSFSYSESGVRLTLNLPVEQPSTDPSARTSFSIVGALRMVWIGFLFLVTESTLRLEFLARRAAEIRPVQYIRNRHSGVKSVSTGKQSEVLEAIANLHNTIREAQNMADMMKRLHNAEVEKGVLQLQLLTARSDFEDLTATIGAIVKKGEAQDTFAKLSYFLHNEKEAHMNQNQVTTEPQKTVESIRALVAKLAASKRESEALLTERKRIWSELIEAKADNASLHDQIEERDAKISRLQKSLEGAELYGEEMWQWGECWAEQCKVAQDQCKLLETEEKIRADQRLWEEEREDYLREAIEERFGSLEKPSSWDDFMAFEHVDTLLDVFEKGRYIHRDHIPLTLRAVPWPIADDPRWFFRLSDITKESVESFLLKYHNMVAKGDDVLYTRFLSMIRLIFDKDLWNPAQSLAGITNPKGFMDAGATVFEVVEAEIERLESRMSAYASSSSMYF